MRTIEEEKELIAIALAVGLYMETPASEGSPYDLRINSILEDNADLIQAYAMGYTERARVQFRMDSGRCPEWTPSAVERRELFMEQIARKAKAE